MRRAVAVWVLAGLLLPMGPGGTSAAQDLPPAQDLKRMYDDALVQLRAAQDRKNELATENERLKAELQAQVARAGELEMSLAAAREAEASAKREAAELAGQTYTLRVHHAAWQAFVERHPRLRRSWQAFLGTPLLDPLTDFESIVDEK